MDLCCSTIFFLGFLFLAIFVSNALLIDFDFVMFEFDFEFRFFYILKFVISQFMISLFFDFVIIDELDLRTRGEKKKAAPDFYFQCIVL